MYMTTTFLANEVERTSDAYERGKPSFGITKTQLNDYQRNRERRIILVFMTANAQTWVHTLKL
jgi:hypothetical protein